MYKELFDLSDRVAVITGGGRNIGLASAMALGEFGAKIVIAEIDPKVGEEGLAALKAKGIDAEVMQLDVTDSQAVTACADAVVKKYGRIDIAVANAGIALSAPGEDMPDEQWHKVIDINLNGVFYTDRAFGKHMLNAGKGAIVQHRLDERADLEQPAGAVPLQRRQGRRAPSDQVAGRRVGQARRAGQRSGADLHRDRNDPGRHGQG